MVPYAVPSLAGLEGNGEGVPGSPTLVDPGGTGDPVKEFTMPNYGMRLAWSPEDQVYVASCPELGDLSAHGPAPADAAAELSKAMDLAIETFEEEDRPLPEPRTVRTHSGQFRVRLPGSLHAWLAGTAEAEGVSLNTFVVAKLSEARGVPVHPRGGPSPQQPSLRAAPMVRAAGRE